MSEPAAQHKDATPHRHLVALAPEAQLGTGEHRPDPSPDVPLSGEQTVEAFYRYVRTDEFRLGFEQARGLDAEQLAERLRRGQRARARQAAAAIAAQRPQR